MPSDYYSLGKCMLNELILHTSVRMTNTERSEHGFSQDIEELELLMGIECYNYSGTVSRKQYINRYLPYDSAIPHLVIYCREIITSST